MAGLRHSPAQIVLALRRAEDLLGHGRPIRAVTAELGISEATFHRWRAQYGGIKASEARRLAELEAENRQLRAAVANQTLDIVVLRELLRTLTSQLGDRVDLVQTLGDQFDVSQRRACQIVGEPRTTVRRALRAVETPDETRSAETVFATRTEKEGAFG